MIPNKPLVTMIPRVIVILRGIYPDLDSTKIELVKDVGWLYRSHIVCAPGAPYNLLEWRAFEAADDDGTVSYRREPPHGYWVDVTSGQCVTMRVDVAPQKHVLRLDWHGQRAARRRVALGLQGVWDEI